MDNDAREISSSKPSLANLLRQKASKVERRAIQITARDSRLRTSYNMFRPIVCCACITHLYAWIALYFIYIYIYTVYHTLAVHEEFGGGPNRRPRGIGYKGRPSSGIVPFTLFRSRLISHPSSWKSMSRGLSRIRPLSPYYLSSLRRF